MALLTRFRFDTDNNVNGTDGKANITADEALNFAKVKMAEGHDRATIKAKIVKSKRTGNDGRSKSSR